MIDVKKILVIICLFLSLAFVMAREGYINDAIQTIKNGFDITINALIIFIVLGVALVLVYIIKSPLKMLPTQKRRGKHR